jgi:hypothetical protein
MPMAILPRDEYDDPAVVLERKQAQDTTCKTCIFNDKTLNECLLKKHGYPNGCNWWKGRDG